MNPENQKENELLNLEHLLVKLEAIKTTLENIINVEDTVEPIISLHTALRRREDYNFQFTHGGILQGFMYSSGEILNLCSRLLALVKEGVSMEVVTQEKSNLLSSLNFCIDEIKHDLKFRANLNFQALKRRSPPGWFRAPLYFVSYAHKDSIVRDMLTILMCKVGFEVKFWIDEFDLERFHEIPKELSRAMKRSKAAILFLSKNYFESKWCNKEWQALFMRRFHGRPALRLYLIRIDESPVDHWPPLLQPYYYTDCSNYPSPRAIVELGKLAKSIYDYEDWSRWKRMRRRARPRQ